MCYAVEQGDQLKRIVLSLSTALLGLACANQPSWTSVPSTQAFRATALTRAAFELSCGAEQVQLTPLNSKPCLQREDGAYVCSGGQMGVQGCGKKTTFIFPPLGQGDDWVRNSEVLEAPAPASGAALGGE